MTLKNFLLVFCLFSFLIYGFFLNLNIINLEQKINTQYNQTLNYLALQGLDILSVHSQIEKLYRNEKATRYLGLDASLKVNILKDDVQDLRLELRLLKDELQKN